MLIKKGKWWVQLDADGKEVKRERFKFEEIKVQAKKKAAAPKKKKTATAKKVKAMDSKD